MPRTKRPSRTTTNGVGPAAGILTLAEAAEYLRLSEEAVLRAVQDQGLPARHSGAEWRFLKDAIDDWLRTGPAGPASAQDALEANKQLWLSLAGKFKDDDLVRIFEEAYRQRGHTVNLRD